ncbi:MAG: TIGR01841 family phasin [Pseudomonadota bacterium]
MTKASTAAEKEFATAEINFNAGTDALKAGFEKAIAGYDSVMGYGKDTAEALIKSATVAGKGAETLHNEIYAYTKQSMEESIAAGKAILGAKSVHEAIELQTGFAKTAFENYVAELTKFNQLFTAAAKDSFAPLQGCAQAWVATVQTNAAA